MLDIAAMARAARGASAVLATVTTQTKNAVLRALADDLLAAESEVLAANGADVVAAREAGLAAAKLARLTLTPASIAALASGLREVAALPDPVGMVTRETVAPSGLIVRKVRVPLGVVGMIYEARPGVTLDAFALCFKAGNAAVLKGGREAAASNRMLAALAHRVLERFGLPAAALTAIVTSDRGQVLELLRQRESIDLMIPRGGEDLIRWVAEHSTIPTIQHYKGVNHAYVDVAADVVMARRVCVSAKTSAPATCNALECVLVHREIAEQVVPGLLADFASAGVQVRGCPLTLRLAGAGGAGAGGVGGVGRAVTAATADDFGREFLDLIVAMKIVSGLDEAVAHIARFGSGHSECILTQDEATARAFLACVQASCVLHNASTRMNDGGALGLGAEIGISTTRLHAYGPMGLEDLTIARYVCVGTGQTR